jgi:arsenate reductase
VALGRRGRRDLLAHVPAQVAGCLSGAIVANAMFGLAAISISTTHRATGPHLLAETIAHPRPAAPDLLPGPHRAQPARPRRGRRPHRRRLLLHQLDELRQPGDRRLPHRLRHLRRHRPASVPAFVVAQLLGGVLALALIALIYPVADLAPDAR